MFYLAYQIGNNTIQYKTLGNVGNQTVLFSKRVFACSHLMSGMSWKTNTGTSEQQALTQSYTCTQLSIGQWIQFNTQITSCHIKTLMS